MTAIPSEFVQIAKVWHGGSGSILYAVASTGGLTRGTIRPSREVYSGGRSEYVPCTDEEWNWWLWHGLALELRAIVRGMDPGVKNPDFHPLRQFRDFAWSEADRMAELHGIDI